MIARTALASISLLVAACDSIPKDSEGTLDRIRAEGRFSVGIIASGQPAVGPARRRAMLRGVRAATDAEPVLEQGASESLLARLERGEIDLVVGELAPASPWGTRVTILPPLGEQVAADGHVHLVAAARNGENAWIALLHREARKVAGRP